MHVEVDEDEVLKKLVQMNKEIQLVVKDHLEGMKDREVQYAVEVYGLYLNYNILNDFRENLMKMNSSVVH